MGNLLSHVRFYDFSELAGVRYETLFDTIDGYWKETNGGGAIALQPGEVNMQGGTLAGAYALLQKFIAYGHWQPTWIKKRLIRTQIEFSFQSGGTEDNYFGTGFFPPYGWGFGIRFKANGIYGYAMNDGPTTETLLLPLTAPYLSETHKFEALLYPLVRVEFKIDDVWKANITTNVPAGDDDSGVPLYYRVSQGGTLTHVMRFSSALFFQDQ